LLVPRYHVGEIRLHFDDLFFRWCRAHLMYTSLIFKH
jgi:hypothetical protein